MSDAVNLGVLNGHSVGRILKEAVRRAATVIRAQRQNFESQTKLSYAGTMDDVFTSADRAAQEVYLRTFTECFPGCGVLGEEDSLSVAPVAPITAYFTVDPIDGDHVPASDQGARRQVDEDGDRKDLDGRCDELAHASIRDNGLEVGRRQRVRDVEGGEHRAHGDEHEVRHPGVADDADAGPEVAPRLPRAQHVVDRQVDEEHGHRREGDVADVRGVEVR